MTQALEMAAVCQTCGVVIHLRQDTDGGIYFTEPHPCDNPRINMICDNPRKLGVINGLT